MERKRILTICIILMLAFIWGNSLVSGELSGYMSDTIMERMNRVAAWAGLKEDAFTYMYDTDGDGVEEPTSYIIRKAAHITEFALFTVLLWLRLESRGARRDITALLCGVGVAAVDELLQLFSHRGSMVSDVLIDSLGVLLGLGLIKLLARFLRRTKSIGSE